MLLHMRRLLILAPAFLESGGIRRIGCRAVSVPCPALAINPFALNVAQVCGGRTRPSLGQMDQPRLDRHAPGFGRE